MTALRLILQIFFDFFTSMANYLERLIALFERSDNEIAALKAELAVTKDALATALANDASDAETIATARAEAEQAKADAAEFQQALGVANEALAVDAEQDAKLETFIASRESLI
jgi:septal ring factor EnvC (AmiA/AmiB activator)